MNAIIILLCCVAGVLVFDWLVRVVCSIIPGWGNAGPLALLWRCMENHDEADSK